MAAMYAVYHGPEGLRAIAERRARPRARARTRCCAQAGLRQLNDAYFDTLRVRGARRLRRRVRQRAEAAGINFRYIDDRDVGIALNETRDGRGRGAIVRVFAQAGGTRGVRADGLAAGARRCAFRRPLARTSALPDAPACSTPTGRRRR